MIVKLVGAVLVLTSATAIGSLLALQVKEQEEWLKDIKMSLFLLAGELNYHQMPLPEAMRRAGVRHGGRMKGFYNRVGTELEKKEGDSFFTIWRRQVQENLKNAPLRKEQKDAFLEIGMYFTEADANVRENAIEFYLNRLEEDIVFLRKNGKEKAYMFRTMGMLGGMFLLILVM